MATTLGLKDFPEYFSALNDDHEPFPWQQRLVDQLFDTGGLWPELLNLPTASGKSSAVDIALFALAAGLPVPRRIVFVVDRRVIVQQAAEHARKISDALKSADSGILAQVRDGLVALQARVGEDRDPLVVAELRGAIQQDPVWSERPDVAAVIASTVDQVGSRLLFRGYGVSDRMLAVHAGLFANDCLIVLDEVHLARPFSTLLSRIRTRFRPIVVGLPDRWQIVELSATPAGDPRTAFELDDADYRHPEMNQRLSARKPARLVTAAVPADPIKALDALAREHVRHVQQSLNDDRVRSIGVVDNRVRLATAIQRQLAGSVAKDVDIRLLTGRMRGLDRESVVKEVMSRVSAGQASSDRSRRLVVVATQTIEAGADLDFDLIVTDCASIDSLVQRFGRVDRIGRFSLGFSPGEERPHSVIVGTNRLAKDQDDAIYGPALGNTWEALVGGREDELDFGIFSGDVPRNEADLVSPSHHGPILLRNHLDRLARTSPKPDADVDVDSFLHGLDRQPDQDIEIVWRSDVSTDILERAVAPDAPEAAAILHLIDVVPPSAGEALPVPISHARAWLSQYRADVIRAGVLELSDVEETSPVDTRSRHGRPFVAWRGTASVITTDPSELRPGDTVVVPSTYGGVSHHTWDPDSTERVADLAEPAAMAFGRFVLRLNPTTLNHELFKLPAPPPGAKLIPTPDVIEDAEQSAVEAVQQWLTEVARADAEPAGPWPKDRLQAWYRSVKSLQEKLDSRNLYVVDSDFGRLYVVSVSVRTLDIDSDPSRSQNIGIEYPLDAHLRDTQRWVTETATVLGLDETLVSTLGLACLLHDVGKADHRFQTLLREGRIPYANEELLAKSAIPPLDRRRYRLAAAQSGYPPRLRHEVASVALTASHTSSSDSHPELLRFLIATHHGYGRPFFPPQVDPENASVYYRGELEDMAAHSPYRFGSPAAVTPRDFDATLKRYGWFGAAWLESIVRLADHGASRQIPAAHEAD
jgi:CRISPR-associated endonuclease/helicase Cas3